LVTGPSGDTGPAGPTGPTGPPFTGTFFNPLSRYELVSTSGLTVLATSYSSVVVGLPWARTGTTVTISNPDHGRSLGDMVLARNLNVDPVQSLITRVDTNSFDLTTVDSGPTSGLEGAYSLGFTFSQTGAPDEVTGGTLSAPAGGDVQLISLRIHLAASTRAGTTYDLVLPASALNGAGGDTSDDDLFLPFLSVRSDADALGAIGATLSKNVGASFNTFEVGALPAITTGLFLLWQF